jgi:hypothetical protein
MSVKVGTVADTTTTVRHAPASPAGVRTLDRIVEASEAVDGVWADSVLPGDWIVVRTKNSTYSMAVLGKGLYRAAGGWFDGCSPGGMNVRIVGCTWGGAAIQTRLAAAVGMFLEFDNGVRTTRIREVRHLRGGGTTH